MSFGGCVLLVLDAFEARVRELSCRMRFYKFHGFKGEFVIQGLLGWYEG